MTTGSWNEREDGFELEFDFDGSRFEEQTGTPSGCKIVLRKLVGTRESAADWAVSLNGVVTIGLVCSGETIEAAKDQALALVGQWADALGAAISCHGRPFEWPLRPVKCSWCAYVGHDCVGGARDPNSEEMYVSRQGDDVACSVWQGNGATRELRDLEHPRLYTYDPDAWFVQGHYGSGHFDMAIYKFVKNPPTAPADPVCDGCVQKRIDAGDLELVTEHAL
jgi:hypothetical protein